MTHDVAVDALHQGARRMLRVQTAIAILAAAGFGASGIPSALDRGQDPTTALLWAVLGALMWGLPMWFFFRFMFMQEYRRVLTIDQLAPAEVTQLRSPRHLTVRIDENADLVLPTTRRASRLEIGQRVWLTQPADAGSAISAVAEPVDEAGGTMVLWPRGTAAAPSRWT